MMTLTKREVSSNEMMKSPTMMMMMHHDLVVMSHDDIAVPVNHSSMTKMR